MRASFYTLNARQDRCSRLTGYTAVVTTRIAFRPNTTHKKGGCVGRGLTRIEKYDEIILHHVAILKHEAVAEYHYEILQIYKAQTRETTTTFPSTSINGSPNNSLVIVFYNLSDCDAYSMSRLHPHPRVKSTCDLMRA